MSDQLQRLWAWSATPCPLWVTVPVMTLSVLSVVWHVYQAVVYWKTLRLLPPND